MHQNKLASSEWCWRGDALVLPIVTGWLKKWSHHMQTCAVTVRGICKHSVEELVEELWRHEVCRSTEPKVPETTRHQNTLTSPIPCSESPLDVEQRKLSDGGPLEEGSVGLMLPKGLPVEEP
ncbi:hypothetical protein JOB18_015831, partial [Solea senegalensis]